MSIDGYFGPKRGELRLKAGAVRGDGPVLEGRVSVEDAQAIAARREVRDGKGYALIRCPSAPRATRAPKVAPWLVRFCR
jgi:hypothetical protein